MKPGFDAAIFCKKDRDDAHAVSSRPPSACRAQDSGSVVRIFLIANKQAA